MIWWLIWIVSGLAVFVAGVLVGGVLCFGRYLRNYEEGSGEPLQALKAHKPLSRADYYGPLT